MSPRLFLHVMSLEARTRMSYRADFWISATVGFAAEFGLLFFVWQAVFRESGRARIEGYDLSTMLVYYAAVVLFGKLVRGPEFQGAVSQDIYEGGLNRYLVFPTSYFAFKYAQHLGSLLPLALQLVLFGALLPFLLEDASALSLGGLGMALVAVLLGNLLYFLMGFTIQAVAFWADNVWSLAVALRLGTSILGGAMLPLALFPSGVGEVLRWLPFRFLYEFPAHAALGRLSVAAWLEGLALACVWCLVLALPARMVWRRGDLQYSGIGI